MEGSNRRGALALIALCLIAATLLYAPFLGHPFQYDDEHTIVAHAALRQPDAWRAAFAGTMRSSGEVLSAHYRPLTYLTYRLTLQAAGLSPTAFHAVNLTLHLLTVGFLLILVRELVHDRRVALLAAALFALHPAVSEAVLYASARATLLSSLCMLAALTCYVHARQRQSGGQSAAAWWTGWAAAGLAALLAKETSVVLPLLCLATDHLMTDRHNPTTGWARWGPHVAAFGVLIVLFGWIGPWRYAAAALTEPGAVSHYVGTIAGQIGAIAMAIRLFVVPWPLTVDHPLPVWPEPGAWLSAGLVAVWCAIGLVAFASRTPIVRRAGFFAIWVIMAALPTTLWPLNVPFQEHRAYLQHAGLAALTAMGVIALFDARLVRRPVAVLLGAAALVMSGWLIMEQGQRWRDPVRLWDHARVIAPGSFRAHTNAGLTLAATGRWEDAEAALAQALSLNPDYPPALVARGVAEHRRGQRAPAQADYERAARLKPDYVPALYNLGLLAQESADSVTAEAWYRKALAINPFHRDSLLNLGTLLLMQPRTDDAAAVFAAARSVSSDSPEVLYYSGVVAERQGREADAATYYGEASRIALTKGLSALAADAQARLAALRAREPAAPFDSGQP